MTDIIGLQVVSHPNERIIWRKELTEIFERNKLSKRTLARMIATGRLPQPDIHINPQVHGWHVSTLRTAGLGAML